MGTRNVTGKSDYLRCGFADRHLSGFRVYQARLPSGNLQAGKSMAYTRVQRLKVNQLALLVLNATLLLPVGLPARGKTLDDGWLKLEAGAFSLYAPSGWGFHKKQGVDSYVGEFSGDGIVLKFDYGRYSSDLRDAVEPKYVVSQEKVDGHKSKIVYPRASGHGITGIYFSKVGGSDKLCLWGQELTESQRELALKVFRTIRFP